MEQLVPDDTFSFVLDFLDPEGVWCTIASSKAIWDPCVACKQVYDVVKKKLAVAALFHAIRHEQSPFSARQVVGYFHPTARFEGLNIPDKAEDILMKKVSDKILDSYDFLRVYGRRLSSSLFCTITTRRLLQDAKNGDAGSQMMLGLFYQEGFGVDRNEAKAVELFRLAADRGCARAQNHLGYCHNTSSCGLERDDVEAVRLFRLAAEKGDAGAQFHLGFCYEVGNRVVGRDNAEAVRLFHLAAEQGHAGAQCHLGVCYKCGTVDLARDEVEAGRFYRLAAEQGNAFAQCRLGTCYEYGRCGLERNEVEAVRLYILAADRGYAAAQSNLGDCYEKGRCGLERDEVEAARLYSLAAEQGDNLARRRLDRLER